MSGQDKIYKMVSDQIKAWLEKGYAPWHKSWSSVAGGFPLRMSNGHPYRGINVVILFMEAIEHGYTSPWWGTLRQIDKLHGHIRQGEHPTTVIYWNHKPRKPREDEDPDKKYYWHQIIYTRAWNADQVDGLPAKYYATEHAGIEATPIESAELIIKGYRDRGPTVVHGGDKAFYQSGPDRITLPPAEAFKDMAAYYKTRFHEEAHSTGHTKRLHREGIEHFDHFGSGRYAREELVAEFAAAMLNAVAGIEVDYEDSAAYIGGWIKAIEDDPRLVVMAAAQAQHAADYIQHIEFGADEPEPVNGDTAD